VAVTPAQITATGRRRSTAGAISTGVTFVQMARASSALPARVRRKSPVAKPASADHLSEAGRASRISAAALRPAASTSTCPLFPASRATVGHHAHSTASLRSRPTFGRPYRSSRVTRTAQPAAPAWIGVVPFPAGDR
jgi:hypothetical protein